MSWIRTILALSTPRLLLAALPLGFLFLPEGVPFVPTAQAACGWASMTCTTVAIGHSGSNPCLKITYNSCSLSPTPTTCQMSLTANLTITASQGGNNCQICWDSWCDGNGGTQQCVTCGGIRETYGSPANYTKVQNCSSCSDTIIIGFRAKNDECACTGQVELAYVTSGSAYCD